MLALARLPAALADSPLGCSTPPCAFGPVGTLAEARSGLQDILNLNLLPFWRRLADESAGEGYALNHAIDGTWQGPANLSLISQARMLWFFARLMREGLAEPADEARAARGFSILADRFLDADNGGYFWELDWRTLQPSLPDKHIYGQVFPLMAMAEYALATGSEEAGRLARQHYAILDRHMWDRTADNIVQARYRDWSPLPPGARDYRDQVSGTRTHHTRIHFMSAVSTYHELDPSPEVSVRLARLVQLTERGLMTTPCFYFRERDGSRQTNQRFGHDIEAIHMLLQARARLGRCGSPPSFYGRIVDDGLRLAEDRNSGGIMTGGPVGKPATNGDKEDWAQADALLTLAELYRHSRRADRAQAMFRQLTFIGRWQVDWARGSWFRMIDAAGVPYGSKAGGPIGGPFHTVRGILGTLRILEAIDGGLPKGGCTFL